MKMYEYKPAPIMPKGQPKIEALAVRRTPAKAIKAAMYSTLLIDAKKQINRAWEFA